MADRKAVAMITVSPFLTGLIHGSLPKRLIALAVIKYLPVRWYLTAKLLDA